MKHKINKLDMFIYRIFRNRWNKILTKKPELWLYMFKHGLDYIRETNPKFCKINKISKGDII